MQFILVQCNSNYGPRPGTGPRRFAYRAADRHPKFQFFIVHYVQYMNMVQLLYKFCIKNIKISISNICSIKSVFYLIYYRPYRNSFSRSVNSDYTDNLTSILNLYLSVQKCADAVQINRAYFNNKL